MGGYTDLHERIDRLCERARTRPCPQLVDEMNDVLSEGYARALSDERRLVGLEERLVELLLADERPPELRTVAEQRREAARCVAALRNDLARMHEHFVLLGGGS